jgi:alpha-tubulin suppressor-like RCC1 family protein
MIIVVDNVTAICAGMKHAHVITDSCQLWSFGSNQCNQLGLHAPVPMSSIPRRVEEFSNVLKVSAGASFTLVLDADHALWGFGSNYLHQLGIFAFNGFGYKPLRIPILENNIKSMWCGMSYSVAQCLNGDVWVVGDNRDGQLCLGHKNPQTSPILNPILKDKEIIVQGDVLFFIDLGENPNLSLKKEIFPY